VHLSLAAVGAAHLLHPDPMITFFGAVVIGILQGVAELFPIASVGL
jgi:hypothetical protein